MTSHGTPVFTPAADGFPVASIRVLSESAPEKSRDSRGKTRPSLLFAHATGFCGEVWRPVRSLLSDYDRTSLDFRGHGASASARTVRSWWEMASDVLAVSERAADVPDQVLIGVGHSMGGASLVMAELLRPGTFAGLVLVEPIIFAPPYRRDPDHPLVTLALRRRDRFASRAAVLDSYGSKPPFSPWHPDALAGYIEGGFVEGHDGVRLACSPRAEAEVFTAASAHAAWERLAEIDLPVTILYGHDTDTYPPGHGEALADRFPDAEVRAVPDTGHFLPMEMPEVVAEAVRSIESRIS